MFSVYLCLHCAKLLCTSQTQPIYRNKIQHNYFTKLDKAASFRFPNTHFQSNMFHWFEAIAHVGSHQKSPMEGRGRLKPIHFIETCFFTE